MLETSIAAFFYNGLADQAHTVTMCTWPEHFIYWSIFVVDKKVKTYYDNGERSVLKKLISVFYKNFKKLCVLKKTLANLTCSWGIQTERNCLCSAIAQHKTTCKQTSSCSCSGIYEPVWLQNLICGWLREWENRLDSELKDSSWQLLTSALILRKPQT